MKKKILVLGTGNAQTDFIQYCKSFGLEVHACSYKPEGRGVEISDRFSVINITDVDKIAEYAENNSIDFIYSVGSDIAMPTLTAVSKKLNLPVFISPETAYICNNKTLLRNTLKNISEYSIASQAITQKADLSNWSLFPAIIKPADSQGQRGVQKIDYTKQVNDAYEKAIFYSRSNTAIIEEYIKGFEISVNLYVLEGEVVFRFVTERISFDIFPGGIIKSHLYPVNQEINVDKIRKMCLSAIKTLDIRNGPVYLQVKIDHQGQPKIIEITPRLDGCHIWRLIKEVKGINLFEIILKQLKGEEILINREFCQAVTDKIPKAELSFFTSPPNTPFHKRRYSSSKEAIYTEWYYNNNDIIRPINQYAEKVGYQILEHK